MNAFTNSPLIAALERELTTLDERALRRRRRIAETPCAPRMRVDGRDMLAFCSNDYLGLASHPRVIEALREGALRYGAGSGASHLISGHTESHALLEERLAQFVSPNIDQARALYFCTGYMANLAIITALARPGRRTEPRLADRWRTAVARPCAGLSACRYRSARRHAGRKRG